MKDRKRERALVLFRTGSKRQAFTSVTTVELKAPRRERIAVTPMAIIIYTYSLSPLIYKASQLVIAGLSSSRNCIPGAPSWLKHNIVR